MKENMYFYSEKHSFSSPAERYRAPCRANMEGGKALFVFVCKLRGWAPTPGAVYQYVYRKIETSNAFSGMQNHLYI